MRPKGLSSTPGPSRARAPAAFNGFPYLDVPWPGLEPPIAGDSYNWQTAEVEYTTGTPGQNQPYPQSLFLQHVIVGVVTGLDAREPGVHVLRSVLWRDVYEP